MKFTTKPMGNKQQTAIDWLRQEWLKRDMDISLKELFIKAKAMEKEQIEEAFDEGQEYEYQYHINSTPKFYSETYYKETYGE